MPAGFAGDQLEGNDAALGDADHGGRSIHPRKHSLDDRAAFIKHKSGADATGAQQLGNRASTVAGDFFVVPEAQVDVCRWGEACRKCGLGSLENRDDGAFVIERSAGVDGGILTLAVNLSAEGWARPLGFDNRHDVIVGHQHSWCGRACTLPMEEQ